MNGGPSIERDWSRGRWATVVTLLFLVQALLAWRLSDRAPLLVREELRPFGIRMVPPAMSPDLAALLELSSPTRFVLPGRDGFSGAWLTIKPLEHRSPGWSNPPQWLALKPEELLVDLNRFGATNQPERTSVSDRLSRPQQSRVALGPEFQLPAATRVSFAGDVTLPELVSPLAFPVLEHAGLLAPTVVSVVVDQRGRVFQASLAANGSSGSAAADQLALQEIRRAQFAVDPRISPSRNDRDFEQLRRARVTVHWWTKPPAPAPATNAPPGTPAGQPVPLQ